MSNKIKQGENITLLAKHQIDVRRITSWVEWAVWVVWAVAVWVVEWAVWVVVWEAWAAACNAEVQMLLTQRLIHNPLSPANRGPAQMQGFCVSAKNLS